jgi:hypothetical protein
VAFFLIVAGVLAVAMAREPGAFTGNPAAWFAALAYSAVCVPNLLLGQQGALEQFGRNVAVAISIMVACPVFSARGSKPLQLPVRVLLPGLLVAAVMIVQWTFSGHLGFDWTVHNVVFPGWGGMGRNQTMGILALAVLVSGCALTDRGKQGETLYLLLLCSLGGLAIYWGSRTFGFVVGAILCLSIVNSTRLNRPSKILLTVLVVALGVALSPSVLRETFVHRFYLGLVGRDVSTRTISNRFIWWQEGISQFMLSPVFGRGIPAAHARYPFHSYFVEVLFESGVVGAIPAFLTLLWLCWPRPGYLREKGGIVAGFALFLLAMAGATNIYGMAHLLSPAFLVLATARFERFAEASGQTTADAHPAPGRTA